MRRFRQNLFLACCAVTLAAGALPGRCQEPEATPPASQDDGRSQLLKRRAELIEELKKHRQEGRLIEALDSAEQILALERELAGAASATVEGSLTTIVDFAMDAGEFGRAEEFASDLVQVRTELFGADDYRVIDAEWMVRDAKSHAAMSDADRHTLVAADLVFDEAVKLHSKGQSVEALPKAQESYELYRDVLGDDHPRTAYALVIAGYLHLELEQYDEAEPKIHQALAVITRQQGPTHPDTAFASTALGQLYWQRNESSKALPVMEECVSILKVAHGEKHLSTAKAIVNLAACYYQLQEYERAEPLFRQGLAIYEEVVGEDNPQTGTARHNLGVMYMHLSDYVQAEHVLRTNLSIRIKSLGGDHPETAMSQLQLARVLISQRQFDQARPLLDASLATFRTRRGEQHFLTALCLEELGLLETKLERYQEAESYLVAALAIRRATDGDESLRTAHSLNQLGYLYIRRGDTPRARAALEEALAIVEAGGRPDGGFDIRHNLAVLDEIDGKPEVAQAAFGRNADLTLESIERGFSLQSERQKLATLQRSRCHFDTWVRLAARGGVPAKEVYDRVLRWKGVVLADAVRSHLMRTQPEFAEQFAELETLARDLSALSLQAVADPEQQAQRLRRIEALTRRREEVERGLSRQSADFRVAEELSGVNSDALTALLPKGTALVDFLILLDYPIGDGRSFTVKDRHLVAFILQADGTVSRVDFGPMEPIGQLIDAWILNRGRSPNEQARGADAPEDAVGDENREPGRELRSLLWAPIEEHLGNVETVLISPDGALCRFPFAAFPGASPENFLIEERAVVVVPAPQLLPGLVKPAPAPDADVPSVSSLLLVGDVDYGASPGDDRLAGDEPIASLVSIERSSELPIYLPLPHTRTEIEEVELSYRGRYENSSADVLTGTGATEAEFRRLAPHARWLHLATHGFFAPASIKSALSAQDGAEQGLFGREGVAGFHPALLSGVVLTGANAEHAPNQDDGILTALEVAALDLKGVELAVLSACETGLGEEAGGEGVLGLQRAFQLAGARTVVSSLWTVPDEATSALMQRFYGNLWARRMTKIEALRDAQLWMLRGRDAKDMADVPPADWAAFVLSGAWQ